MKALYLLALLVLPISTHAQQTPVLSSSMNAREYRALHDTSRQIFNNDNGTVTIVIIRTIDKTQFDNMKENSVRMRNRLNHLRNRSNNGTRLHRGDFRRNRTEHRRFRGVRLKVK